MRKIISCVLTLALAASIIILPQAQTYAAADKESGIITLLNNLEIMQGDENGDMRLDAAVSRAEFAKIAIAASPEKNSVAIGLKISPYKDVPYTTWYAPYIKAAVSAGYVEGYLDSTYRPDNTVKYEEAITIMLRVLGYSDDSFGSAYPYGQISEAQGLDMLDDVGGEIGSDMTRRQVMYLIYNTLQCSIQSSLSTQATQTAQTMASGVLLSSHDCTMTEDVDIISTIEQDSSMGTDKVFTSAGLYSKGDGFNDECVGMTGTVFIKNSKDIIAFVPDDAYDNNEYETYFIYSLLPNSVVAYDNGELKTIDIPDSAIVYQNQNRTTYAAVKSTLEMGDTLYLKRTNGGSVDYITYESDTMTGPEKVISDAWLTALGGSSSTTVMRDGVKVNESSVLTNDIVYYSAPLDIAFAYSNKVTGIYESASPTKDAPSSVTVSGTSYEIEGVDAFNNLSSSGSFNYGDTVTLCMGKDGKVAGVVTANSVSASAVTSMVGYITDAGQKIFTDSNGKEYTGYYVTMVSPDGTVLTYETDAKKDSLIGCVVRAELDNGKAKLTRQSNGSVYGTVSYNNMKVGDYKVSSSVNIIDVMNDTINDVVLYKKVYMQRLDGISLTQSKVLYAEKNARDEIVSLILNNVTGDVYDYGVVKKTTLSKTYSTNANGDQTESTSGATYKIDINGSEQTYVTSLARNLSGPAAFAIVNNTLKNIVELSKYKNSVEDLTDTTAVINRTSYALSDKVVCYKKSVSTEYQKITIDAAKAGIQDGSYTAYAYYDKSEATGGRIRVIVCNIQ